MQKSAEYLGLDSQSQLYAQRAVELKDNINSAFFDRNGYYVPFSQGSNVFPMFLGIIPSGADILIANMLIEDIVQENQCHVTTGSQLTKYLFEVLNLIKPERYRSTDTVKNRLPQHRLYAGQTAQPASGNAGRIPRGTL